MSKFIVEDSFWELFPRAEIGVILFKDTDNRTENNSEVIAGILEEGQREALQYLTSDDFAKNEVVANWREAFTKFKKKKGMRASIEAF